MDSFNHGPKIDGGDSDHGVWVTWVKIYNLQCLILRMWPYVQYMFQSMSHVLWCLYQFRVNHLIHPHPRGSGSVMAMIMLGHGHHQQKTPVMSHDGSMYVWYPNANMTGVFVDGKCGSISTIHTDSMGVSTWTYRTYGSVMGKFLNGWFEAFQSGEVN